MSRSQVRFLLFIVAAAVIVLVAIWVKSRYGQPPVRTQGDSQELSRNDRGAARASPSSDQRPSAGGPVKQARPAGRLVPEGRASSQSPSAATMPRAPRISPADRARAATLLEKGLSLDSENQLVAARAALADGLNTGALEPQQADAVRAKLAELANKSLFSREVLPDDPCTGWYTIKPGEVLVTVERALKLRVPTQLILKINGIADARKIQANQKLKVLYGPFHAVVSKSRFTLDVYLEEAETRRMIFVRRFRVGIGKDGATPVGPWRVAVGGKTIKPEWTPPSSSGLPRGPIRPTDPRYPLGKKGYWISLEGVKPNPYTKRDGYGIHDTNDPASIGKAASMGCIRLVDDDMEQLFFMLYEGWSTVTILP